LDPLKFSRKKTDAMRKLGIRAKNYKMDSRKMGNTSHLQNKVLYILGRDSKNYRNGYTIWKKDKHYNHVSPYPIMSREENKGLHQYMVDSCEIKQKELKGHQDEMLKKKIESVKRKAAFIATS
jgi:hypothetical protein